MGVRPGQVADLLALRGDAVDNIPGAPGIGDKGAQALIERFGSVEGAMEHAAEVERKAYRESLQNNVEQIRMSKRWPPFRPMCRCLRSRRVAHARADESLLKAIYKEMEFHSLLKELGPAEDSRTHDYRAIGGEDELKAWMAEVPDGAPVAIAISKSADGEFRLDTIGLAWRPGEARAVTAENLAQSEPYLECGAAAEDCLRCEDRALNWRAWALKARISARHYAVRLPAGCRPGGVTLKSRHGASGLKLGASPEQHADIVLEIFRMLEPAIDARGLRKLYASIELRWQVCCARMERTGIRSTIMN